MPFTKPIPLHEKCEGYIPGPGSAWEGELTYFPYRNQYWIRYFSNGMPSGEEGPYGASPDQVNEWLKTGTLAYAYPPELRVPQGL